MGITIKELSEISGFSTATISRVISNKDGVKPETREAIERLLIEKKYRTNVMEMRQMKAKNHTVILITGDLGNWYYMETVRDCIHLLDQEGYHTLIAYSGGDPQKEERILLDAVEENCAGVVFMNVCGGDNVKQILTDTGIPVVFLNRGIKKAYFNCVVNDNYNGAYQAVEYLIQSGHRKICHLMGNSNSVTAQDRRRGFVDAMEDNHLVVTKNSIHQGIYSWESGYEFGEYVIKKALDFTAVFIGNYQMAAGFLDCAKEYGLKIPEQISVVCFDETPEMRRNEISTVCADPLKMAEAATDLLLKQVRGKETQAHSIYQEPVLIKRASIKRI